MKEVNNTNKKVIDYKVSNDKITVNYGDDEIIYYYDNEVTKDSIMKFIEIIKHYKLEGIELDNKINKTKEFKNILIKGELCTMGSIFIGILYLISISQPALLAGLIAGTYLTETAIFLKKNAINNQIIEYKNLLENCKHFIKQNKSTMKIYENKQVKQNDKKEKLYLINLKLELEKELKELISNIDKEEIIEKKLIK